MQSEQQATMTHYTTEKEHYTLPASEEGGGAEMIFMVEQPLPFEEH